MPDFIGTSIGSYHILEQLGEGGMAVVYKAYDIHREREVAVKVIRTDHLGPAVIERSLKRFEREAREVARLDHPNIVRVIDFSEHEHTPYLVMELLAGGTLKRYLKDHGRIYWQEALRLLIPIAEALSYAHQHGIIHRDVKPSNILLTTTRTPMLTDFGVAKITGEETTMDLTGSSVTVGTPEYMAPEQVVSKSVDHRVDIYALGVVLYEMVTGRKPFTADTPMAVVFKHMTDPLPRPRDFVRDLPSPIEKMLFKALAKKPENRYQNMNEMIRAMKQMLPVVKPVPLPPPVTIKPIPVAKPRLVKASDPPPSASESESNKNTLPIIPAARKRSLPWLLVTSGAGVLFLIALMTGMAGAFTRNMLSFDTLKADIISPVLATPTITAVVMLTGTSVLVTSTPTVAPTSTVTPWIITAMPTAGDRSVGTIQQNVNCRTGPGTNYSVLLGIPVNSTVQITGRNRDGSWYLVKANPTFEGCWVMASFISLNPDLDFSQVAIVTAVPPITSEDGVNENTSAAQNVEPQAKITTAENDGEPYAEVNKLEKTGDCSWSVAIRVYNLTPNAYVNLYVRDQIIDCATGEWNPNYWGLPNLKTDSSGTLIMGNASINGVFFGGWGVGYGEHNWTFTDTVSNRNVILEFSTK